MKQRLRLVLQEFLLGNEGLVGNHVVERVNHLLDKLREYIQLNRDSKIEAMYIQLTDTEKVTVFNDDHSRHLADTEASCQPQSTLTSCSIDNTMVTAECDNMDEAASNVSLTYIGNKQVIIVELCQNEIMI